MKRLFAILACALFICQPVIAATNAASQQVVISAQLGLGLQNLANTSLLNYQEPNSTTARFANTVTIFVPPATNNLSINLTTLFPGVNTAIAYAVSDISSTPGQQVAIGMASGGSRFNLAPMGFFAIRVNGSAPTLFVDNASLTTTAILQVSVMAN